MILTQFLFFDKTLNFSPYKIWEVTSDFKEGFELKKEKRALAYARDVERAKRFLKDKGFKKPKETEEDNLEKTEVPVVEDQMLAEAETEPQQGLMARRV